jgi:hypothetical protein
MSQTLTLGGRRFVVLSERDYLKLQERASNASLKKSNHRNLKPGPVNPEFAADALRELRKYRKSQKSASWTDVKAKLGL